MEKHRNNYIKIFGGINVKNSCSFFSIADDFSGVVEKFSRCGVSCGSYFLIVGLNTEIYGVVNLRIYSIYGKIETIKNSVFGHFSHRESCSLCKHNNLKPLFFRKSPSTDFLSSTAQKNEVFH